MDALHRPGFEAKYVCVTLFFDLLCYQIIRDVQSEYHDLQIIKNQVNRTDGR